MCADAKLNTITTKDNADKRISEIIALCDKEIREAGNLANNKAIETEKWVAYCENCRNMYQQCYSEKSELMQKLQGTQEELERYQSAPPGTIHPQLTVINRAHVKKPTPESTAFLEMVKELENRNKSNH